VRKTPKQLTCTRIALEFLSVISHAFPMQWYTNVLARIQTFQQAQSFVYDGMYCVHAFLATYCFEQPLSGRPVRADELKRRRDFMAGVRGGGGNDDVTMTSRQQLVPDDMSSMTSLCVDEDDVSVCLQLVGSRSPLVTLCYAWFCFVDNLYL